MACRSACERRNASFHASSWLRFASRCSFFFWLSLSAWLRLDSPWERLLSLLRRALGGLTERFAGRGLITSCPDCRLARTAPCSHVSTSKVCRGPPGAPRGEATQDIAFASAYAATDGLRHALTQSLSDLTPLSPSLALSMAICSGPASARAGGRPPSAPPPHPALPLARSLDGNLLGARVRTRGGEAAERATSSPRSPPRS
eukprot:CAMPEP_0179949840 /NCGR_PEP_ID=MMETSP0983-20121128/22574_1 /TAXON_ID=483367 /ORGANISM="non described non described, Strain CCMP 2436" /LENGTH=201 /DNA_ID=CAMNT_0021859655 /DNA_START=79 /DNA_END=680 /DNA_ORIENTATION=+